MSPHPIRLVLLLASACVVAVATAAPPTEGGCRPQVREGWVRLGPAGMPMMAGFARIENACTRPVTITGADSPAFEGAELHESSLVDGVSRMRPVPELRIAPGDAAVLEPGGKHLMLMRPRAPLDAGSAVVVTFRLADGGEVWGEFEVRKPGAR